MTRKIRRKECEKCQFVTGVLQKTGLEGRRAGMSRQDLSVEVYEGGGNRGLSEVTQDGTLAAQ